MKVYGCMCEGKVIIYKKIASSFPTFSAQRVCRPVPARGALRADGQQTMTAGP